MEYLPGIEKYMETNKYTQKLILRFYNTSNEISIRDKNPTIFYRIGSQQQSTILSIKTNINNNSNSHKHQNQLSLLHIKPILLNEF